MKLNDLALRRQLQWLTLAVLLLILAGQQFAQAAPTPVNCEAISAATIKTFASKNVAMVKSSAYPPELATASVWQFEGNIQLFNPLPKVTSAVFIISSKSVELDCTKVAEPFLQVMGAAATVCLYQVHLKGCTSTAITITGGAHVLLNSVRITNSSSSQTLIDVADSQFSAYKSTIDQNTIWGNSAALIRIAGKSTVTISGTSIEDNHAGSSTMIDILYPDAGKAEVKFSAGSIIKGNTAGRLLRAASRIADATTIVGANNTTLSDSAIMSIKNGTDTSETVATLMQYVAARSPVLSIQDTKFENNSVVLELLALQRVHAQLRWVLFRDNVGLGAPVSGSWAPFPNAKKQPVAKCCVRLESSTPLVMPPSWTGAVYKPDLWDETIDCKSQQAYVLATATEVPQTPQAGSNCSLPQGTRLVSHMIYSFNGTLWLQDSRLRGNNFSYGSLIEASNRTSVVMTNAMVMNNTVQTVLNMTGQTLFMDFSKYQDSRLLDESYRDLNEATDNDTFYRNVDLLENFTNDISDVLQSALMYIRNSSFKDNDVYVGVFRSWGTRDGTWKNRKAYHEGSASWYIQDVQLHNNSVLDIGMPQRNVGAQWLAPSVIGFIHVNATLVNVNVTNNTGLIIINVEVSSVTAFNSLLANNTVLDSGNPRVLWFMRWSTLGIIRSSFTHNCYNASASLIQLFSVATWITDTHFANQTMALRSSSLVNSSEETNLRLQRCIFTGNRADRLVYTWRTKHITCYNLTFDGNLGTGLYLDSPKKVFNDKFARTNLTQLHFNNNKNATYGAMHVLLEPETYLSIDTSSFTGNQGNRSGALFVEQTKDTNIAETSRFFLGPDVILKGNIAEEHGGGLRMARGELTIFNSTVANNSVLGSGGGIYADVLRFELGNVTIRGNKAQSGAGAAIITKRISDFAEVSEMEASKIENSTIESNRIDRDGLGLIQASVLNCGLGGAGGLCLVSPAANRTLIKGTSMSNNTATFGGAMYIDCGMWPKEQCGVNLTLDGVTGLMHGNQASKASAGVATLSSKGSLHVQCSDGRFYNLTELLGVDPKACPGWQWPQQRATEVSDLGISTTPSSISCRLTGLQLTRQNGSSDMQVVSGTTIDAHIELFDEDNMRVMELPGDLVVRGSAVPKDLVMVGDHPGEIEGTIAPDSGGQLVLGNITVWPTQNNPNNSRYTLQFKVVSTFSEFPVQEANVSVIIPRCTLGEYLIANTHWCQTCSSLNSTAPLFSLHPKIRCEPCVEHGNCSAKHGQLLPRSDFFQPSFLLPQIIRCPIPEACKHDFSRLEKQLIEWKNEFKLANDTSDDSEQGFLNWLGQGPGATGNSTTYSQKNEQFMQAQCSLGYKGFMCSACADTFGRYFGRCQRCLTAWANTVILLLIIAGVLAIVALLTSGHMRKTLRKHAGQLQGVTITAPLNFRTREHGAGIVASPKHAWLVGCCFDASNPQSVQSFEKMSHIFKVLTTFVQVNFITRGLQWVAPRQIRQFFTHLDFSSSPGAWISLDCSLQHLGLNAEQVAIARAIFMILLPGFCLLIAYATWACCLAWHVKKKQVHFTGWRSYLIPRLWLSTVQTCYILYPIVTINIFNVFTCDPLEGAQQGVETNYWDLYAAAAKSCRGEAKDCNVPIWRTSDKGYWTENHETLCYTGSHAALMYGLAVPALLVFAIGVPVGLVLLLWTHRHQLQQPTTELQFGFLYEEYKPRFSYWEAVIMARKVALLITIIAVPYIRSMYKQYIQVSSCILIMQVCFLLHLTYQPFSDTLLNRLETISIMMTIANMYMFTYWMIPDMSQAAQLAIMVLLLFLNTLVILYFLAHLLLHVKTFAPAALEQGCSKNACSKCLSGLCVNPNRSPDREHASAPAAVHTNRTPTDQNEGQGRQGSGNNPAQYIVVPPPTSSPLSSMTHTSITRLPPAIQFNQPLLKREAPASRQKSSLTYGTPYDSFAGRSRAGTQHDVLGQRDGLGGSQGVVDNQALMPGHTLTLEKQCLVPGRPESSSGRPSSLAYSQLHEIEPGLAGIPHTISFQNTSSTDGSEVHLLGVRGPRGGQVAAQGTAAMSGAYGQHGTVPARAATGMYGQSSQVSSVVATGTYGQVGLMPSPAAAATVTELAGDMQAQRLATPRSASAHKSASAPSQDQKVTCSRLSNDLHPEADQSLSLSVPSNDCHPQLASGRGSATMPAEVAANSDEEGHDDFRDL